MTTGAKILVVDDSPLQTRVIGDALRAVGYQVEIAHSGEEALSTAAAWQPDAITLDVIMPGMTGYQVCRALRQEKATARTPVIMLTSKKGIEEKVAGFEAGADDYLVKPVEIAELLARLKVLLLRVRKMEQAVTSTGQLFSVFSLRGGVGATSLAVNLAIALRELHDTPVALVDLALPLGQVSLMFNAKPQTDFRDLAERKPDDLDSELVKRAMYRHPSGLHVMPAPIRPEDAETISGTDVNSILPILKDFYAYVVVDLASNLQEITLTALDNSEQILLIMAPDLASIRAVAGALSIFSSLGYPTQKTKLVLNCLFERHGVPQKNIESALQCSIDFVIPFAPDVFVSSLNRGAPVVLRYSGSEAATQIKTLAQQLTQPTESTPDEEPRPVLARVRERLGV